MNKRVRYLRKNLLKMSMESFGEKIGLSKAAISSFEAGKNGMSEMAVKAICREYGVSEKWLRTGEGDVFTKKTFEDEFNSLANSIMTDVPGSFRQRLISVLAKLTDEQWQVLSDVCDMLLTEEEKEPQEKSLTKEPKDMTDEEIEAAGKEYAERLRVEKKAAQTSATFSPGKEA